MDAATQTMIQNLQKNTGKTLQEWIAIVGTQPLQKHGEIIRFLKEKHGMTHGFANLVALKAKGSDAGSAANTDDLVIQQYKGREHLKGIYDALIAQAQAFGNDVEIAPKNAYVSLKRKKQFAILQPATKTRFELALNLKGQEATGKLQAITAANAMCSHKINLSDADEVDGETIDWLRRAYDKAG